MNRAEQLPNPVQRLVALALEEDHAHADATSLAVVPAAARASAILVARADGVLAGCAYAEAAFRQCDAAVTLEWQRGDGDPVQKEEIVLRATGTARGLLAAERTALNFLQHLSGVATKTAHAVAAAGAVQVLDTRKTLPLLRDAQKRAVVAGGGENHRRDLEDQLLLKENHFALSGQGFSQTVKTALAHAGGRKVGVEAETLEQAQLALRAGAAYVLLDNFRGQALVEVVQALRAEFPQAELEVSGGFQVDDLPQVAGLGVNRISMGALTHSVAAFDLSMLMEPCA